MLFNQTTYIGIDPTAGQRPFTYAALDADLNLMALGEGTLDEVLAFVGGQEQAFAAVNAPRQPNQGLLKRPEVRTALPGAPRPGRWEGFRLAEYELGRRGIAIPRTPANEANAPRWMQMGFQVFRRLDALGYRPFPAGQGKHISLEVYPHAVYTALLGHPPFPKDTLEGRLQRQLALADCQVAVPDAMAFFEEITRHRLLQGRLPEGILHSPAELDALAAAFTAWQAASHPEEVTVVGDAGEGQIAVPVSGLKAHY